MAADQQVLRQRDLYEPRPGRIQLYFPAKFTTQFTCPLLPGGKSVIQLVPGDGVMVFPAGSIPDYPVTIPDPRRMEPTITLDNYFTDDTTQPEGPR